MFGLFRKSDKCPVDDSRREVLDKAYAWLVKEFGNDHIRTKSVLTPSSKDFPVEFKGDQDSAYDILDILAAQVDIDSDDVEIDFYEDEELGLSYSGIKTNASAVWKGVDHERYASDLNWSKQNDGCYHIGLESMYLGNIEKVISSLARGLAHVKLLGEERVKKSNKDLTEMATVIFGFGIFRANTSFQIIKDEHSTWDLSSSGPFSQMDWGYSLALHAFVREERSPEWSGFLNLNVKSDFDQSARFIQTNLDQLTGRFVPDKGVTR